MGQWRKVNNRLARKIAMKGFDIRQWENVNGRFSRKIAIKGFDIVHLDLGKSESINYPGELTLQVSSHVLYQTFYIDSDGNAINRHTTIPLSEVEEAIKKYVRKMSGPITFPKRWDKRDTIITCIGAFMKTYRLMEGSYIVTFRDREKDKNFYIDEQGNASASRVLMPSEATYEAARKFFLKRIRTVNWYRG